MNVLLAMLIVAIAPETPLEIRYPEAVELFHCTFDPAWDQNFDQWPDEWTRRRGPGFPHYLTIKISEEPSPEGAYCLRMDLDGGGGAVFSPPIPVGRLCSYVLEGYVKTEELKHDSAYLSITLLNAQRIRLSTFTTEKIGGTTGWTKVRLGPISPNQSDAQFAIIGLHLQPGSREDLKGAALFDDIWVGRLPRMEVCSSNPYNFFTDAREIEVRCTVSGFLESRPQIGFELEDELGRNLARTECELTTRQADAGVELTLDSFANQPMAQIGEASWRPPISGPGFYRVRATMQGRETLVRRQELDLAVVEPSRVPAGSEFGWTLGADNPLPFPQLSVLLGQAGIGRVKYPFWWEEQGNDAAVSQVIAFAERLAIAGIELVGMLKDPPQSLRSRFGPGERLSVADLFTPDPKVWYPSLEPVLMRLATSVHRWQLGDDNDTSFVGYPNLAEKISQIKAELDRIGQDVSVGIGWGWLNEFPAGSDGKPPCQFLALSADPPMTRDELSAYLEGSKNSPVERWVEIEPLSRALFPIEVRAADLVRRMMAAKIQNAEAIFCPRPFSTDHGLMNDDGTPGDLFLPWRTAALSLSGAKHLGSIQLPGGSDNQIFVRAADAVMVVWNDEPTEEILYLGEDVRQIDLWGRSVQPAQREHRQVIRVGKLPTFVVGLSEPITRWQMDFDFTSTRIPSIFGQSHANSFHMKNFFPSGVYGDATLVMPEIWTVEPRQITFRLAGQEELSQAFQIKLPYNANAGSHEIRVDFDIEADRKYRFSVYRRMDIGLGDVYIEIQTRLTGHGDLEVQQTFVNDTDREVTFRCDLFAPDRRRQNTQLVVPARNRDTAFYFLPEGEQLLAKTLWLRAEETGGPRILNYRFVATP